MIATEELRIEPFKLEDAASLSSLMVRNKKRFQSFFPGTLAQNLSKKASEAYITTKEEEINTKFEYTYGIKDKETDALAGLIILKRIDWDKKQGELAYCIDSLYEGRGWITLVVQEISTYCFAVLKLQTLQIIVHETNVGSQRVAEKCGYSWIRTLENEFTPTNGIPMDMELYELNSTI